MSRKTEGLCDSMQGYLVLWVNHAMCTWGTVCRIGSTMKVSAYQVSIGPHWCWAVRIVTDASPNRPRSALPIDVVRRVVAPEPTLESRVRIRLALLGNLLGVGRIAREFEEHAVGVCDIDRAAIAVLEHQGVGRRITSWLDALLDRLLRRLIDLQRDVMKGRLRDRRAKRPLVVLIGEL